MGTGTILLGTTDGLASHPGGGSNTLTCFMLYLRNQDKLRPCGPPWLVYDFTFTILSVKISSVVLEYCLDKDVQTTK